MKLCNHKIIVVMMEEEEMWGELGQILEMGERDYARKNFSVLSGDYAFDLNSAPFNWAFPNGVEKLEWRNLDLFHHYYQEPFVYCLLYKITAI